MADRIQARAIRRQGELLRQLERPSQGGRPPKNGSGTPTVSVRSLAAPFPGLHLACAGGQRSMHRTGTRNGPRSLSAPPLLYYPPRLTGSDQPQNYRVFMIPGSCENANTGGLHMKEKEQRDEEHARDNSHFAALGRLVVEHTNAELAVKSILFNLVDLPDREFDILLEFGRIKLADMPTIIEKLVEARESCSPRFRSLLVDSLKKFQALSQRRNQLSHWLWLGGGLEPSMVNLKPSASRKKVAINLEDLQSATRELREITTVLSMYVKGSADSKTLVFELDEEA
jgi:hypothetical protein